MASGRTHASDSRKVRTTSGVRIAGDVVLRPRYDNAGFVDDLLKFLEASGFTGAPRSLGFDHEGRHLLEFVPGTVPHRRHAFSDHAVVKAAELLRRLHDTTARYLSLSGAEVIVHGDAGPHNMVFAGGVPVALIDWDDARPGSRLEDVASAIWGFTNLACDREHPRKHIRHIRLFCSAYGGIDPKEAVAFIERDLRHALATHKAAGRFTCASVFVPWVRWFDTFRPELPGLLSNPEDLP